MSKTSEQYPLMLLKVLLCRYKWMDLYLEAKCGPELRERMWNILRWSL